MLAAVAALATLASIGTAHAGVTTLYEFEGESDGAMPEAGLIQDRAGNLYGTTFLGGYNNCGTVFKLAPDGTETVLHSFSNMNGDGGRPMAGLVQDRAGNLYGTTYFGPKNNPYDDGYGIVFKIAPDGTETVLHTFTGSDGGQPAADLILDKAGNLYGTTSGGYPADGTVFKLAPDGTETVLRTFSGVDYGLYPDGALILDRAGNLYGTTSGGGSQNCPIGCGVVFKLAPDGTETVLYSFAGKSDGGKPEAGLIQDEAGNFYGTTKLGGMLGCKWGNSDNGCGTVFKLAPDGTETVLYSFTGKNGTGANPNAGLIRDKAGNLYGTTLRGGDPMATDLGGGIVFKLAPDGTETVLYSVGGGLAAGLLKGADGQLYGTALGGNEGRDCYGNHGCGTVFRLNK